MFADKMREIEESYLPFGNIDDGLGEEEIVDDTGQRWQVDTVDRMLEEQGRHSFF